MYHYWQQMKAMAVGSKIVLRRFLRMLTKPEEFQVIKERVKFVPRVVSEPLFQSAPQKTTLAQGVVFVRVFFEIADITLSFIAISPFRFLDGL